MTRRTFPYEFEICEALVMLWPHVLRWSDDSLVECRETADARQVRLTERGRVLIDYI